MCRVVINWLHQRTAREWTYYILAIAVIVFVVMMSYTWMVAINNQVFSYILKASDAGLEGYTENFSIALKEFTFVIKDYSTIALTFFGFTFLGDIFFLYRRGNTEEDGNRRYIIFFITLSNVLFFLSFIFLTLLYSQLYPYILIDEFAIKTLLNVGFSSFVIAISTIISLLLFILIRISIPPRNQTSAPLQ